MITMIVSTAIYYRATVFCSSLFYFSILTKSSLENIEFIHNRNPVIVNKNNVRQWFSNRYEELLSSSDVINYELSK